MIEKFESRIGSMDHKFSMELAKLNNIIENEILIEEEEDADEDDKNSDSNLNSVKDEE